MLEKISTEIFPDEGADIRDRVANIIAETIKRKNSRKEKTILGLATGATPLDIYRELIRFHKEEGLDFSNVVTFNLDEYYGLEPSHVNSYHRFMWENLFEHINIKKRNVHIPDGKVKKSKIKEYCAGYEKIIKNAGGIDIQLLGIGRDGHIGFNEPGSRVDSRTRLVRLDRATRTDALPDFGERRYIPTRAITMGLATILEAKQIILIATGNHKAPIIRKTVEGRISRKVAASYLQTHSNVKAFLDMAAASELTRIKTPWVLDKVDWSDENFRVRAVCYLSEHVKKPIRELEMRHFLQNSLTGLSEFCQLPELADEVIRKLKNKIKNSDKLPKRKTILVFSPHPDDDIISMGATLRKLVKNGNKVYSVYMTPGYTAVFDHEVDGFIVARKRFSKAFGVRDPNEKLYQKVLNFFAKKQSSKYGLADIREALEIKKIIREAEAITTCDFVGVKGYEFLNLPFYQTGRAKKLPIGEKDIEIVSRTIKKYRPDIVFAAGDLTDPNGTHRLCLNAIRLALKKIKKPPEVWLYRGAWQDYHPSEADVLVPFSLEEVALKREGIFRHESQKDKAPQPGYGTGEFWQRAERKNVITAGLMETYGIKGYQAMEVFKIIKK